ncbi:MAG TPA: hypothetical protein VLU47_16800 [Blastocatellia bacterium]|nr:hypothetical protein [Blastocatellia bacterium]
MTKTYLRVTALLLVLLGAIGGASAQSKKKPPPSPKTTLANRLAETRADLVTASKAYKESLEKLLPFEEDERKRAAEIVEIRKRLVAEGLASKRELEESERLLADAEVKLTGTRRQLGEADAMIAEASGESALATLSARPGSYSRTAALIRYNGTARWALTDITKVQGFFTSRFQRALPVSAYGQTAVHNHLGFDHRNAVDVAVHPDSAEGQAIMAYLRSIGIPFIAFRHAVSGSATGAHIHVGYPSHRIGR